MNKFKNQKTKKTLKNNNLKYNKIYHKTIKSIKKKIKIHKIRKVHKDHKLKVNKIILKMIKILNRLNLWQKADDKQLLMILRNILSVH